MATWTLAASLATLRREVDAAFPGRSKISDGTIGDTAHAARKSDHNPDAQGVVRAWDCTRDIVAGVDVAEHLAEWLRRVKDPRVKYLIFRRRICSSYPVGGVAPYVWRPYDGLNAHEHHLHISVQPAPAGDDGRAWGFTLATPPLEDDVPLDDTDIAKILDGKIDATYTDAKGDRISLGEAVGLAQRWALHGALRAQTLEQQLAALDAKVSALAAPQASVDVAALAAAIAPLLPAAPTAEQVADVLAARLQQ